MSSTPNIQIESSIMRNATRLSRQHPIAIVGMGCRYPGNIDSPQKFWRALLDGFDAITEVPPQRWNIDAFYHPDQDVRAKMNVRKGGFIDGIDQFDPTFFNIAPIEAHQIDPQQRLLLEVTYHAFEDAGLTLDRIRGSNCGVFIGISFLDYYEIQHHPLNIANIGPHTNTGTALSLASNRISHVFDLRGPSISIDTACSSSLTAVHLATQSILNGECDWAIAGGANAILKPEIHIGQSKGHFLSTDGYCKSFDASGNGYVRSEGAGLIILKPLKKALADGDPIYAVIAGSAVNQDGSTPGIAAPSINAQINLLQAALGNAKIKPGDVAYVEAHGTGTPVGDPTEARAIGEVIGRKRKQVCFLGSVKSNMGHLEPAAGIAGLSKAALALKYQKIPPNLHFQTPHPNIDFDTLKLRVPTQTTPWPKQKKRIAGVNSFGFGGANAHVVLEEPPQKPPLKANTASGAQLFVLSARHKESLKAMAQQYADYLKSTPDHLADICFSAALTRTPFEFRLRIPARSKKELHKLLSEFAQSKKSAFSEIGFVTDRAPKIAFVFSGQGPQWHAMGRELLQSAPTFRYAIEEVDAIFAPLAGFSIISELKRSQKTSKIHQTQVTQPAMFAIQIGLARLYEFYGVKPQACVGHSVGEVAAAHVSGALTLKQAVQVIYQRSRLQATAAGKGKMMAVLANANKALVAIQGLEHQVSLAAINGPDLITLSGDEDALKKVGKRFEEQLIFFQYLKVDVPFHSHHMDALRDDMLASLRGVKGRQTSIDLYSTLSAKHENGRHLDANYWFLNLRRPVDFLGAITQMLTDGYDTFVELGPHPIHCAGILDLAIKQKERCVAIPSLSRDIGDNVAILASLGALWTWGAHIKWQKLWPSTCHQIKLPQYVWHKERYWAESKGAEQQRIGILQHPFLKSEHRTLQPPLTASWSIDIDTRVATYLREHRLHDLVVFPGAGLIDLALSAGAISLPSEGVELENIEFTNALILAEDKAGPKMQLDISFTDGRYSIYSQDDDDQHWTPISSGIMRPMRAISSKVAIHNQNTRCRTSIQVDEIFKRFELEGLKLGSSFRGINRLWTSNNEALAEINLPSSILTGYEKYRLHPATLDSCFQASAALEMGESHLMGNKLFIPRRVKQVRFFHKIAASKSNRIYAHLELVNETENRRELNIHIFDDSGVSSAEINGLELKYLPYSQTHVQRKDSLFYQRQWIQDTSLEQYAKKPLVCDPLTPKNWIILGGLEKIANPLRILVSKEGLATHLVKNPSAKAVKELAQVLSEGYGLIYLGGIAQSNAEEISPHGLFQSMASMTMPLIQWLKMVEKSGLNPPVKTIIATQNAQVIKTKQSLSLSQSGLLGFGRVMINEYPKCRTILVDLDTNPDELQLQCMVNEIFTLQRQLEVAYRNGSRFLLKVVANDEQDDLGKFHFDPHATHLFIGGKTGIGLAIAKWAVSRGARDLFLVNRSEPKLATDLWQIENLRQSGAHVTLIHADITKEDDVERVFSLVRAKNKPLKSIFHAAAVFRDEPITRINNESCLAVFDPKALGAWRLHQATLHDDLDQFVMLSSISSVIGNPGQASYAMANAFLDALSHYRRSLGLKASSLSLGPVSNTGHLADRPQITRHLEKQGIRGSTVEQVISHLDRMLLGSSSNPIFCDIDWTQYGNYFRRAREDYRFGHLIWVAAKQSTSIPDAISTDALKHLQSAGDVGEQKRFLETQLTTLVSGILGLSSQQLHARKPFSQLGFDSLMATQLRSWVLNHLQIEIPILKVLRSRDIADLSEKLLIAIKSSASGVTSRQS